MLSQLALRTLVHDRGKLVVALVGVIFSVVLVNVQGGLFIGLMSKASLLIDQSGADTVSYTHLTLPTILLV